MPGRLIAGFWIAALVLAGAGPSWAAGSGCVSDGSCSAPSPSCAEQVTYGTDNCGNPCYQWFYNPCNAAAPTCATPHTDGTHTCGEPCSYDYDNSCSAPWPACEETTYGSYACGGVCSRYGGACSSTPPDNWQPYGYAEPNNPQYSFGLPSNNTRTMLGLTAKGNIVLGDYTDQKFQDYVVPLLGDGADAITMPYAIDPTDATLGYHDAGFDASGKPKFSGNYDQMDGGYKLNPDGTLATDGDGNPVGRKFYESTLSDAAFQSLLDANWDPESGWGDWGDINATMFTNHAVIGYTPRDGLGIFGSMVARDDALVYNNWLNVEHDARLTTGGQNQATDIALPFSIKRPSLCGRVVCSPSGCGSAVVPACP